MKTRSHVLTGIVHGGAGDAASLSLWIEEAAGLAHLCGHSGSCIPLDGPVAPAEAPEIEAIGESGHCSIFEPGEIEELVADLDAILADWITGAENDAVLSRLEDRLQGVDLCEWDYLDWLAENDPSVLEDLAAEDEEAA